jgi:polyferredoxin
MKYSDRIKLWWLNKFPVYFSNIFNKLLEVAVSAFIILLSLRFLGYQLTWLNYVSAIALYFIIEEIELVSLLRRLKR